MPVVTRGSSHVGGCLGGGVADHRSRLIARSGPSQGPATKLSPVADQLRELLPGLAPATIAVVTHPVIPPRRAVLRVEARPIEHPAQIDESLLVNVLVAWRRHDLCLGP